MDVTVLGLASSGLALTTGGLIVGTCDVMQRFSRYSAQVKAADDERRRNELNPVDRALRAQHAQNVARVVEALEATVQDMERRLAAVTGATEKLRRLWLSAAIALLGVALSGAADVLAAVHAR